MRLSSKCDTSGGTLREALDELAACVDRVQQASDPWAWSLPLLITVGVAAVALAGVVYGAHVQHRIARADQLWKRLEWAYQSALSDDENTRMLGLLALERLQDPEVVKREGYVLGDSDVALMNEISDLALLDVTKEGSG